MLLAAAQQPILIEQLNNFYRFKIIRLASELDPGNALNQRFNIKGQQQTVADLAAVAGFYHELFGDSVVEPIGQKIEETTARSVSNINNWDPKNLPAHLNHAQFIAAGTQEFADRVADINSLNDLFLQRYMQSAKIWQDAKQGNGPGAAGAPQEPQP